MSEPVVFAGCEALSEEERMRRIGAFVCRVAWFSLNEVPPDWRSSAVVANDAKPDKRVLAFLGSVREASPIEIRATLGLSRSMTYRVLQRLVLLRQVASYGSTKSIVYSALAFDPKRN